MTGLARRAGPTDSVDSRDEAARRDALCRALPEVVAEYGWAQTSPQRVAREAGLPPDELWSHFRSLEHCFVEVYDRMMVRLERTAIRSIVTRTLALGRDAWEEQLDAIFGGALAFYSVQPALARTCVVEVLEAGPLARARRDEALSRFTGYAEGLRLSHGEPMPPLAAEMIVLGTNELIYNRVARGEGERLPEILPELRRMWQASVAEHSAPADVVPG